MTGLFKTGHLGVMRPLKLKEPHRGAAPHIPHYGGLFHSNTPGRTDNQNVAVPHNSYVIPADVVGALGENNTAAGSKVLDHLTGQNPSGPSGGKSPVATNPIQLPGGNPTGGNPMGASPDGPGAFAKGGMPQMHPGGNMVPIIVAGGEYLVHPDSVRRIGNGDMASGHKVLDKFVLNTRAKNIKELKGLKGPKK